MRFLYRNIPFHHHHHFLPPTTITATAFFLSTTTTATTFFIRNHTMSTPPPPTTNQENDFITPREVFKYHNQTKHNFYNYARGPRGLDWANQPNPFRRYDESSTLIPLSHFPDPPLGGGTSGVKSKLVESVTQKYKIKSQENDDGPLVGTSEVRTGLVGPESKENGGDVLYHEVFSCLPSPKPVTKTTISRLFYDSLALSAWKTTGFSTWSLRVNPSSGNLHPTEAYLISPGVENLSDSGFVAHYAPKEHSLEVRARIPSGFFGKFFPEGCFLIGLSSIFWREAWKYGERAFRYCNHDVGHAIGAVTMAAAGLGWDVKVLDGLGYKDLERLMGLEIYPEFKIPSRPVKGKFGEIEFEHPDCVLLVFPNGAGEFDVDYKGLSLAIDEFSKLDWKGKPNSLSKEHVCWDIIYRTAEVVKKPLTSDSKFVVEPFQRSGIVSESSYKGLTLREIVRKRRSAVDMDGETEITRETFYQILSHCMPSGSGSGERQRRQLALPFRALPWDSEVHAVLFVHRVVGVPKGLYFLVRNEDHFEDLKKSTRSEFKWQKPEGCPADLPLYELGRIDCRQLSKSLSCHQDIASDGCFSLGMVAHFEPTLHEKGVWMYPRLFWETGVLGQVLYLEAHAVGISATGIGCFFDDPVHEVLGLKGSNYQSLYHFTVGGPVVDKRIMSLPAYPGPVVDA